MDEIKGYYFFPIFAHRDFSDRDLVNPERKDIETCEQ